MLLLLESHVPITIMYFAMVNCFWVSTADDDRFNEIIDVLLPLSDILCYFEDKYTS